MSTQIDYARIVLLNRTRNELNAANPVLLSGEVGIADVGTVNPDFRVGDGIRPWTTLPSFRASGIGGGIFAPFEVQNTINGHLLFQVNDLPGLAPGQPIIVMGPGEAGVEGTDILHINGNVDGYGLVVSGATHTQPNIWLAAFATPVNPGRSNGVWVAAGTNSGDACFALENAASTHDPSNKQSFMLVRGDGSGYLGPEPNQLVWDAQGNFNITGHATLPGRTMSELTDVQISGLRLGDVLQWNGTAWGNVSQLEGYVTRIETGTGLRGGPITATGTIALEDTMVAPGWYHNATIVVDQQGRINYATDGELNTLADVELTDPQEGQALTWNGTRWINSTPAKALEDLLDVDIVDKAQGEVLSWNEQTERWTNSPLPGGSVIALETLQDVDITDPEPGQVLTWDGSNWINEKGGGGASVTVDTTPPADPESGWLWWDSVGGQLYVWYDDGESAQWVIANSGDGGGGGGETPGGGGGLELDFTPWDGCTIRYRGDTNKWTWTNIQADEWGTWIGANSDTTALQVRGADNSLTNMWTAQFQSGNGTSRNGVWIVGGNTNIGLAASDMLLRVMNRIGPYNEVLMLVGDGSGWIGPNVSNRLYWDSGGNTTLTGNMAKMIGLSVPIAFSIITAISEDNTNMLVSITMPLTIPANLNGSQATCNYPTASSVVWTLNKVTRGSGNLLNWTQIGTISWNSSNISGVFSGAGGSFAVGDMLALSTPIDPNLRQVAVTIQATRA